MAHDLAIACLERAQARASVSDGPTVLAELVRAWAALGRMDDARRALQLAAASAARPDPRDTSGQRAQLAARHLARVAAEVGLAAESPGTEAASSKTADPALGIAADDPARFVELIRARLVAARGVAGRGERLATQMSLARLAKDAGQPALAAEALEDATATAAGGRSKHHPQDRPSDLMDIARAFADVDPERARKIHQRVVRILTKLPPGMTRDDFVARTMSRIAAESTGIPLARYVDGIAESPHRARLRAALVQARQLPREDLDRAHGEARDTPYPIHGFRALMAVADAAFSVEDPARGRRAIDDALAVARAHAVDLLDDFWRFAGLAKRHGLFATLGEWAMVAASGPYPFFERLWLAEAAVVLAGIGAPPGEDAERLRSMLAAVSSRR